MVTYIKIGTCDELKEWGRYDPIPATTECCCCGTTVIDIITPNKDTPIVVPDKPKEDTPTKPSENGNSGSTTPTTPSENTGTDNGNVTPSNPSDNNGNTGTNPSTPSENNGNSDSGTSNNGSTDSPTTPSENTGNTDSGSVTPSQPSDNTNTGNSGNTDSGTSTQPSENNGTTPSNPSENGGGTDNGNSGNTDSGNTTPTQPSENGNTGNTDSGNSGETQPTEEPTVLNKLTFKTSAGGNDTLFELNIRGKVGETVRLGDVIAKEFGNDVNGGKINSDGNFVKDGIEYTLEIIKPNLRDYVYTIKENGHSEETELNQTKVNGSETGSTDKPSDNGNTVTDTGNTQSENSGTVTPSNPSDNNGNSGNTENTTPSENGNAGNTDTGKTDNGGTSTDNGSTDNPSNNSGNNKPSDSSNKEEKKVSYTIYLEDETEPWNPENLVIFRVSGSNGEKIRLGDFLSKLSKEDRNGYDITNDGNLTKDGVLVTLANNNSSISDYVFTIEYNDDDYHDETINVERRRL